MPKKTIISQAISIKKVTVIIVIIACLIAILIGVLISTGIDMTIKGIIVGLREAAKGNLTVSFTTKRKDEFYILINEIQNTFTNMKELLQEVKDLSGEVSDASTDISKTSGMFLKSTKDIGLAVSEIEQGVSQQASDAEECLIQMEWLSKKIVMVNDSTKEINQIAEDTKYSIKEGTTVTDNLNNQTESTIEITTNIIDNIELLAEKSTSIEDIILVINEIASKTNLLSLNASIEAARAGEHGRGFAVVASEIRTLAQQSQQSVSDIKKIIGSIQDDTQSAVKTARNAENVLKLQKSAVKETTQSYQNINNKVENLMEYLNDITESIENIEEAKLSTLGSIESMSAVLEEIAASSGTVNHTSKEQLSAVDALNESAKNLNLNAENLAKGVYRFQV